MIRYLKYRHELSELYRKKEALNKAYVSEKKGQTGDDLRSTESQEHFEASEYAEDISILVTTHLIHKANSKFIPLPDNNEENWDRCRFYNDRRALTEKGISELRSRLRKEQRENIELGLMILAGSTGLIGALTGLIALINK